MLVGVGGLSWWDAECLRSSVYAGGVCGCVSVSMRGLRQRVEVGNKVCRVGG